MQDIVENYRLRWRPDGEIGEHFLFYCWDGSCALPGIAVVAKKKWEDPTVRPLIVKEMVRRRVFSPRRGLYTAEHIVGIGLDIDANAPMN